MGGWRRPTASSAALVAGLLYFLRLPAAGFMLDDDDDDAMRSAILVLFYSQGLPDSIGSNTSVLDVMEMWSQRCPAPPLESKTDKRDDYSPPFPPSSSCSV